MSDTFTLDVVQAAELKYAFERNGYTNADVKKLSSGDILARLLPVVRGHAEVAAIAHVIDCDADPYVPEGWTVEEHKKGGQFIWSPDAISLYLPPNQQGDKYIEGYKLRQELADKPCLNANVLDYLLQHPHLIPESWKVDERGQTRYIYFWGTVYRSAGGHLCVRCLYFGGEHWHWHCYWLDDDWNRQDPSALRAS